MQKALNCPWVHAQSQMVIVILGKTHSIFQEQSKTFKRSLKSLKIIKNSNAQYISNDFLLWFNRNYGLLWDSETKVITATMYTSVYTVRYWGWQQKNLLQCSTCKNNGYVAQQRDGWYSTILIEFTNVSSRETHNYANLKQQKIKTTEFISFYTNFTYLLTANTATNSTSWTGSHAWATTQYTILQLTMQHWITYLQSKARNGIT